MKRRNVDRARGLRQTMTDAERKLWYCLRNRHLVGHKFRRQHEIGQYIVDFVCTDTMLIVELDGGRVQNSKSTMIAARAIWKSRVIAYCASGTMMH